MVPFLEYLVLSGALVCTELIYFWIYSIVEKKSKKLKSKNQKNKNGQWSLWASVRYRHGRWIEYFWETNERQCILDKLDCDDQLLSDGSDISSEIDDAGKREYDSYDSDKFSKDSLSGDVCGHRYDTISI